MPFELNSCGWMKNCALPEGWDWKTGDGSNSGWAAVKASAIAVVSLFVSVQTA